VNAERAIRAFDFARSSSKLEIDRARTSSEANFERFSDAGTRPSDDDGIASVSHAITVMLLANTKNGLKIQVDGRGECMSTTFISEFSRSF
jgi:hypothetical protein